jgi:hypothetical protein
MRQAIYDAFDDNYSGNNNERLFPFIDHENEDECLDWLVKDIESKFRTRSTRLEMIRRLDGMFKGSAYTANTNDADADQLRPSSIYNFISEMVEAKVAQRSRFKPSITVMPNNIDINDENRAEAAKLVLTGLSQTFDFETILADGDKINFLSGQSYTYVSWDKNSGGKSKVAQQYIQNGVELKYEDGTVVQYVMEGDIDIKVLGPDKAYEQIGKKRWADVDDISIIDWIHVDELKSDYPEKEKDINATDSIYHSYFTTDERQAWSNHCMVVTYYHKPTRFLPNGAFVKFTPGCILEKTEYPYKDSNGEPLKNLPIIFDTDIDVQGEITGRPFVANIEKLQRLHDMASSSLARGFAISNSPKWVYAKGSIDPNKLTNNHSSLEFKGPIKPSLEAFNGVPQMSIPLLEWTEKGIQKASTNYNVSRGEAPPGVKAAVALQFLDEQELQRESRGMAKRQKRIINLNKMVLSRVQQFYTPQDGRIVNILGEDNQHLIADLSTMDLSGEFDIRMENSSSLPDSKTGKIAAILDLNIATQADPMFNKEAIAQMLDLGNDRRFKSQNTAGLKAAQFKLQNILNKRPTQEPRDFDDFIVEYPIFIQALRQREYKGEDQQIMQALSDYIMGMEFLMWKKSQMNPILKQKIMMFNEYPVFYKVPLVSPNPSGSAMAGNISSESAPITQLQTQQKELEQQGQINQEQGV